MEVYWGYAAKVFAGRGLTVDVRDVVGLLIATEAIDTRTGAVNLTGHYVVKEGGEDDDNQRGGECSNDG
jgi:hypothetical protein